MLGLRRFADDGVDVDGAGEEEVRDDLVGWLGLLCLDGDAWEVEDVGRAACGSRRPFWSSLRWDGEVEPLVVKDDAVVFAEGTPRRDGVEPVEDVEAVMF